MQDDKIRDCLESILQDELRLAVPDPETDLVETGLLDSLALVDMIAAIEQRFGIVVDLVDLDLDDLRTVQSLTRLVHLRLGSRARRALEVGHAPFSGRPSRSSLALEGAD